MISRDPHTPATAFLALVRHAHAVRAGPGQPDGERELSREGREAFSRQLARLESLGFGCDHLWTSPLRRARETAQMLGELCAVAPESHEGLCSDPESRAGSELIAQAAQKALSSRVVLVGHQPWLAQIARSLGALDVSEVDCGEFIWLSPKALRGWTVAARLVPYWSGPRATRWFAKGDSPLWFVPRDPCPVIRAQGSVIESRGSDW